MSSTRVLTSAVLIPILFIVVWLLPREYFAILIIAAAAAGQHEFYTMAKAGGAKPLAATGIVLGGLLIVFAFASAVPLAGGQGMIVALCVLAVLGARLFARGPVDGALTDSAVTLLGIVYVALLFGYQVGIHRSFRGKYWLAFLYLVIWASDTGAYYVGTSYGRRRLYEKISPKKSIEGLVGGLAAALVVALLCKLWLVRSLGALEALVLAFVITAAGTLGDLAESLLKRSVGVKDSGSLIPGHGGILDRMDSMLFAAPVLYYYLRMK